MLSLRTEFSKLLPKNSIPASLAIKQTVRCPPKESECAQMGPLFLPIFKVTEPLFACAFLIENNVAKSIDIRPLLDEFATGNNPATTRNPYNGLLGFVSVAGNIQYRRYRYVSQNNKSSLEVDLNGLGWDNGLPKKWELYGGQWNQKQICYASGICRLYGSGFDNVLITSKSTIEPTASITSNGYLHVEFGTQLSYARLYVYYDLQ